MHLVERETESAELAVLLRECGRGHGGAAVISGGIGCGKTELLRGARRRAEDVGFCVLSAVGSQAERHSPDGVLGQLPRYADTLLEGDGSAAALLGGIGVEEDGAGAGHGTLGAATTAALHQSCTAVLRRAERDPVLVCVDDVQFADPLSLHWLLHLLNRAPGARVAVVLTECVLSKTAHPQLHAVRHVRSGRGAVPAERRREQSRGARRLGPHQQGDRGTARDHHEHRRTTPDPGLPEARRPRQTRTSSGERSLDRRHRDW